MNRRQAIRVEAHSQEPVPIASHGEGVFVHDTDGRRYLDGSSGAFTAGLGHAHPGVLAALRRQAGRISFVHRAALRNEPAEALAARLSELTGYPFVLLGNTGSDAVEAAQKLALQYWQEIGQPGRTRFLSHRIGYHGATLGALSLSGSPVRRAVAEPLLHPFATLTPPYAYRFSGGDDESTFSRRLADQARQQVRAHGRDLAAVVVEPVGGAAAGVIVPPGGYLPALSRICREEGTLLITDEVLTGVGRTGRMLAADRWRVRADIVVLGKGLGAGYTPVSAVLASEPVADAIASGSGTIVNGHTYSGNPLSAAVALAVLDIVHTQGLVAAAERQGRLLRVGIDRIAPRHSRVGEVRGVGLLHGVELVLDRESRRIGSPVGSLSHRVVTAARRHGLLLYPATGGVNDALLVAPPLTISESEVDLLVELLDRALTEGEEL